MKTIKKQVVKIIVILFLAGFIGACNNMQKQSDKNHNQTETTDGHDHSDDDGHHTMEDGETMADTTSMEHEMH